MAQPLSQQLCQLLLHSAELPLPTRWDGNFRRHCLCFIQVYAGGGLMRPPPSFHSTLYVSLRLEVVRSASSPNGIRLYDIGIIAQHGNVTGKAPSKVSITPWDE